MWTNRRKKADMSSQRFTLSEFTKPPRLNKSPAQLRHSAFRMRRCDAFTTLSINRFLARKPRASHWSTVVRDTQSSRDVRAFLLDFCSCIPAIEPCVVLNSGYSAIMTVRAPPASRRRDSAPQTATSRLSSRTCRGSGAKRASSVAFHRRL